MPHGMMRIVTTLVLALLSLETQGVERVIHYHNDALGSPIAATDQDGRVVWRKSYAPYGQPIGQAAPNEPGYTGKFEEPDLGIQNFGARWYDPRIGRFLAIDPAGFDPQNPQSFNRYAYANNNPYRYVDPDGRAAETALDVISLGLSLTAFGNDPSLANGLGLAYDALATALPVLPGGFGFIKHAAETVGDAAKVATKIPDKLYHYTGADPSKIALEGLTPGGSGNVFTTADGNLSPMQAQVDLALPPNRGLPNHLLEIDVGTLRQRGIDVPGGTQVGRSFNMPGGSTEVVFPHALPPDAIEIVR